MPAAAPAPAAAANMPIFETWQSAWEHADTNITSAKLSVAVTNPVMSGSMIRKFVTYQVRTEPFGYVVRRRYSNFEWLRTVLVSRYPGMLVPPLPPKSVMGNMGSKSSVSRNSLGRDSEDEQSRFVASRMAQLNLYLESIVEIPFLRSDTALLAFLSVQDDRDWEKAQAATSTATCFTDQTEGCVMWRTVANQSTMPGNAERILQDLAKQIETLASLATLAVNSTRMLAERASAFETDVAELNSVMGTWRRTEEDLSTPENVEQVSAAAESLVDVTAKIAVASEPWTHNAKLQATIIDRFLLQRAQYFQVTVEALRELLKHRTIVVRDVLAKRRAVAQAEAELAKSGDRKSASIFGGGGLSLSESLDQKREGLNQAERLLDVFNGGLFTMEIERFHADRQKFLENMMCTFATGTREYGTRMQVLGQNLMSQMDFDEEEAQRQVARLEIFRTRTSSLKGAAAGAEGANGHGGENVTV